MKKYLTLILIFLSISFAQINMSDINELSNKQLDAIKDELRKSNTQISTVDKKLESVEILSSSSNPGSLYFGYDYFKKDINFFDNTPTPNDYKLGPGDEIILSMWGETNLRQTFIINKEGLIYYSNIGFINISNKTLDEAESFLKNELSQIYSSLEEENNSTNLVLELGKIKSINVYFTGLIENPGIHLIHPFSDVFSAIVQAGGVKNQGSLRNVQIIRSNKAIATIDFYSFFINGIENFSKIRILEGDTIHLPVVKNRAQINGAVMQPGFYEFLPKENIEHLINSANGLANSAASSAILERTLLPEDRLADDYAKISKKIESNNYSETMLINGDSITIRAIADVNLKVDVFGRVKFPGTYPASANLKEVLDLAGGFDDPFFRKTINDNIIIIRKDENQFYSQEIKIPYENSSNMDLIPGDKIFIYEKRNYNNSLFYTIKGEVNNPGPYILEDGSSIKDAISKAGGLTILADRKGIILSNSNVSSGSSNLSGPVANISLDTKLSDQAIITVKTLSNVFSVSGNVYKPGLIAFNKSISISKAIELAGGFQKNTLKRKIYVERSNGEIDKVGSELGRRMKRINDGDRLFIPKNPNERDFDITSFIADLSSTLANIAAILIIVDNNQ
tara:strand:+ start:3741 stop:5612 length:1872 start_codon:yes stop_codon:yes gene_type:complete